jgi:hypothetical protein
MSLSVRTVPSGHEGVEAGPVVSELKIPPLVYRSMNCATLRLPRAIQINVRVGFPPADPNSPACLTRD